MPGNEELLITARTVVVHVVFVVITSPHAPHHSNRFIVPRTRSLCLSASLCVCVCFHSDRIHLCHFLFNALSYVRLYELLIENLN